MNSSLIERYRDRVASVPGIDAVRGKTALVVGLGSVGSVIATRLAQLGVHTIGFDPDVLEPENLMRWGLVVPVASTGLHKSAVWQQTMRLNVPGVQAEAHALDVVRESTRFDKLTQESKPDLLIAATDTADSRRAVNAAAAMYRIPALYVALSAGAASVRIEVVADARQGPCHLCSSAAEVQHVDPSFVAQNSNTPYASSAEPAQAAVAALPTDVALGALLATRLAVVLLSGGEWQPFMRLGRQRGNVMFMSLRPDFWLFESAWERIIYQAVRDPDCAACGEEATA